MSHNVLVRYKNPEERQKLIKILKKSRFVNNFEVELVTKNGNSKPTILSATLDGNTISGMIMDITKRKKAEASLARREKALKARTKELEEVNSALRVLLRNREEDKEEFEKKVLLNVKRLVVPYIERLKKSRLPKQGRAYLSKVESGLNEIASSFAHTLFSKYSDLTVVETQIADLVREGKTTKEIAGLLNISARTVETHRKNIRNKMGIRNKRTNLRAYLLSLPK
jgi:DNA-binding CsgD family transcriptional regulator